MAGRVDAIPRSQRGETLIEITLALAILSMILLATFKLVSSGFALNELAKQRTQVSNLLQEQAEALRNYRDNTVKDTTSWNTFSASTTTPAVPAFTMQPTGPVGAWAIAGPTYTPSINGLPTIFTITIVGVVAPPVLPALPDTDHLRFTITATWPGGNSSDVVTDLVRLDDFHPKDCSLVTCP